MHSRHAILLLLALMLASCIVPPRAPEVKAPFAPWRGLTQKVMAFNLARAAEAWDTLKDPQASDEEKKKAGETYDGALALVLKSWSRSQLPRKWRSGSVFAARGNRYAIHLQPITSSPLEVSPLMLDRLMAADSVPLGLLTDPVVEDGVGVPVVGQLQHSQALAAKSPMLPLNGAYLTLTAVLEFDPPQADGSRHSHLHLYNPLRQPEASFGGEKVKLAANYTAPKRMALNDGFLRPYSRIGLWYPGNMMNQTRLYRLEFYDPKRIPVVFIHGMLSDPQIWFNAINAIYADPVLRAHYQPWYFLYPSSLPVPSSSARLRASLEQARARLDPEGDDPGMNNMVLVGHSMGGLLSRMQTIDSQDALWSAYFNCPPEKLRVSKATQRWLKETLRFEKQPFIKRLIFITVPHQGSDMADRGSVSRLAALIRMPVDSIALGKEILTGNVDSLNPQLKDWGSYGFLGLGTLSPKHPYLKALNAQPIPVPHHSIIGHPGNGPLDKSSDLVVPYTSSHLETGTELVVPYWHGCVEKPEVTAEIALRLRQHLRESGVQTFQ
ncbi:hypothetical protein EI77_04343 [Prosthecobacter fusiformis]|uniref:AB hydrolase-1 domain-containing protein n=1 Tax=Prosthecobacter fusiformis TaxID=48464 RepID=A0A4R7RJH1_9BACT|nr:hypothetical protein [Prosthecobacter fusiformis]TDU64159.1 hypothetical protein EI77_04343 [Prosthecobacter fusiformis]